MEIRALHLFGEEKKKMRPWLRISEDLQSETELERPGLLGQSATLLSGTFHKAVAHTAETGGFS